MKIEMIDHDSRVPLYHQIKSILKNRIQEKVWNVGELIPTELELMKEYNVSRTTIRLAINELVQDGLLEKKQGKGTIVRGKQLVGSLGRLKGFAEEVADSGSVPLSRLLRFEESKDLYLEKKWLQLGEDDRVVMIERIRLSNDEPIAIERTYWPEQIGQLMLQQELNRAVYYTVLEENGIVLMKAKNSISAVNASTYDADLLGISPGEAMLQLTRLSYDVHGTPIEYAKTKFRADRYQYEIELTR